MEDSCPLSHVHVGFYRAFDSWLSQDAYSRSERGRKAAPSPKGAQGAQEARLCEPGRSRTTQGPAAATSSERLPPVAAAGLGAAGIGIGHRDMPFEPRNSTETVLCKHAGSDEESARRQVQGALNQVGRRRAKASEWVAWVGLAGRTC